MAKKKFTLIIKTPDGVLPAPLKRKTYVLGRHETAQIKLKDPRVSAEHAKLIVTESALYVEDLGSTNGTYVDGEKIEPEIQMALTERSIIEIDPFTFHVISQDEEKPPSNKRRKGGEDDALPPSPPGPPVAEFESYDPSGGLQPPPGLGVHSQRLMGYLPEIYHPTQTINTHVNGHQPANLVQTDPNDFLSRFLGIFEAILFPIEWTADNFDLFLHPSTAPSEFLVWLSGWYKLTFDSTWTEAKKRAFIRQAHELFEMRGTKWSMSRILEIYTGLQEGSIQIEDLIEGKDPNLFTVSIPLPKSQINIEAIQRLLNEHKPAHTYFELKVKKG
ncbi:MAG: FHA domain-containing protein [Chloroflexota bacterium]